MPARCPVRGNMRWILSRKFALSGNRAGTGPAPTLMELLPAFMGHRWLIFFISALQGHDYSRKKMQNGVLGVDSCIKGPTDFVRGRGGSVKLSKDHHAAIKEERYIPHTSHA